MDNLTISVIGNQILSEILKELEYFSKYKIESYKETDEFIEDNKAVNDKLIIYFCRIFNEGDYEKIKRKKLPIILIVTPNNLKKKSHYLFEEKINIPIKILELEKKIISLVAKHQYKKSSIISLSNYIIDKNERKIKRENKELQLTEREIDFLILFTQNKEPLTRNFILKSVWHYSSETDTHTIETHIHRLRKKILEKFGDNNFIKNNEKGYYI